MGTPSTILCVDDEAPVLFTQMAILPMSHALLANAYATAGHLNEAHGELELLNTMAQSRYVPASYFAVLSIALGDKDAAFTFLKKSYDDRSEHMLYLGVESLVDPLRSDPRFDTLMTRIGLKR